MNNMELRSTSSANTYEGTWAVYNVQTCEELDRPSILATVSYDGQMLTIEITDPSYYLGVITFTRVDCSELP